jgi:hypothetical protein
MEERKNNHDCIIYRKDDNSYGDYGIGSFSFSETMYDRVMNIIMLKNK